MSGTGGGRIGTHPEIGSLIRRRDFIYDLLNAGNFLQFLKEARSFFLELHPNEKNAPEGRVLFKNINTCLTRIRGVKGRTYYHTGALQLKVKRRDESLYLDIYSKLNEILWNGDYLVDTKYRGSIIDVTQNQATKTDDLRLKPHMSARSVDPNPTPT